MADDKRRIEDQAVAALKEDVCEIKADVKTLTGALLGTPDEPEKGLAHRIIQSEDTLEKLEKAGIWETIHDWKRRKPWRVAFIGAAVSLVVVSLGLVIKLVQLMAQTAGG